MLTDSNTMVDSVSGQFVRRRRDNRGLDLPSAEARVIKEAVVSKDLSGITACCGPEWSTLVRFILPRHGLRFASVEMQRRLTRPAGQL